MEVLERFGDFLAATRLTFATTLTAVVLLAYQPCAQFAPRGSIANLLGRCYRLALIVGLCASPLLLDPGFWFFLLSIHCAWLYCAYAIADNHKYLQAYWLVALAISTGVGGGDGSTLIGRQAELLLGVCFGYAVFVKVASPSFRDGGVFVQVLLRDRRLLPLATGLAGLRPAVRREHQIARDAVATGRLTVGSAGVPCQARRVALFMTWWTVAIEALLAVLFLHPACDCEWARTVLLCIFGVAVYLLVPVEAFAHTLLAIGAVSAGDAVLRSLFLGTGALVVVGTVVPFHLRRNVERHEARNESESVI